MFSEVLVFLEALSRAVVSFGLVTCSSRTDEGPVEISEKKEEFMDIPPDGRLDKLLREVVRKSLERSSSGSGADFGEL